MLIRELKEKSFFALYFRHHPSISPSFAFLMFFLRLQLARSQKANSQAKTRDSSDSYTLYGFLFLPFQRLFVPMNDEKFFFSFDWLMFQFLTFLWIVEFTSDRCGSETKHRHDKCFTGNWRYISVTRFLYLTEMRRSNEPRVQIFNFFMGKLEKRGILVRFFLCLGFVKLSNVEIWFQWGWTDF